MTELLQIEAILFTTEHPISVDEIYNAFEANEQDLSEEQILDLIKQIQAKYRSDIYAFELVK